MTERIPLYTLRFFEASARHSSFLKAANELHITPAAVAHQIKRLEASLGVELFDRLPRGVLLNDNGRQFLKSVQNALNDLEQSGREIRNRSHNSIVRIVALHGFIEKWLFPRLHRFRKLNPGIRIELRASEKPVNLNTTGEHIWISHSDGPTTMGYSELLFGTLMAPVCRPDLLDVNDPDRLHLLRHQTHLYDTFWDKDWATWFNAFGESPQSYGQDALGFDLYSMVVQAAVDGMGLAMGHDALVQKEIEDGKLVYPFEQFCPCPKHFYLNTKAGLKSDSVASVISWIREEAKLQNNE
ncbi:LysR substrate-binding domain-containing protein [Brucella pituitosa]|uniref:LysR family transcriptional regulator n=1 Tax=Brucella pituitosa TaxID=571256 RepID=A0ABS3K2M3_9HYPH|nr:LysR substrate-binding domain-containing protein [Brucella pituitosa]MBO1041168.1 LysR family transcriptional regulator [Brucella pituitosa]